MTQYALVLSCEHAVNDVPKEYLHLFASNKEILSTHRGVDLGALSIAQQIQETIHCLLVQAPTTRLLIDYNRSLSNPACFSELSRTLSLDEKQKIIDNYYAPYRQKVTHEIEALIQRRLQVLHLSVHSFTPVLNTIVRNADISFLYDPQRKSEKEFAKRWREEIQQMSHQYKIRMNYPYRGTSDGFTSSLRRLFSSREYIGIEVESNQKLVDNDTSLINLKNILSQSLLRLIT